MENANQGLVNFDEMSRELLQTFNPDQAKSQAKEIGANLLLMIGVPFFLERLKDKLPEDIFTKISELAKDPETFGKNSLKLAQELFNEKIVQPLKGQLLQQMDEYIPALKNLSDMDLSKLSIKDVQDLFTKQLIQKMKANLPPEIANKLPENFTQEDILNSLKDLSKDQALKFAKDNLPPEAYDMLEKNQNILTDPAKLSEFMKGKFDEASSKISDTVSQFKSEAYSRINDIKESIKGEIDKNIQPFKDKIDELKATKNSLQDQLQASKDDINSRYEDIADRLRQMKANNPDYTAEDIQPFRDARDALREEANNIKAKSAQDISDIDSQIADNNSSIEDITNNLVQKVYNLRNSASSAVDRFSQNVKQKMQQGAEKAQEFQQKAEQTVQDVKDGADALEAEARQTTTNAVKSIQKPMTFLDEQNEKRIATRQPTRAFTPDEGETIDEPSEGLFSRIGSFLGFKKTPTTPLLDRQQPSIQMSSPDELETSFSERALGTSNNKFLLRYRAMENTSDITLDNTGPVRIGPYKPAPRQTRAERRLARKQAEAQQEEEPETTFKLNVGEISEEPNLRPSQVVRTAPEFQSSQQQLPRAEISEIEAAPPVQTPKPPMQSATQQAPTEPQLTSSEAPKASTLPTEQSSLGETSGESLGETFGSSIEKLSSNIQNVATKTESTFNNIRQGISKATGLETLDETAAATEEVPVLDVVMDLAGLFGTIFGAKSLMSEKAPPPPIAEGQSYEPDL
jgi:peptidoglycan hydrolase CwlO-like protein